MASQLDVLKKMYANLSSPEQKKQFVLNLDKQLKEQGSASKAYKSFLSECIREYNKEASGKSFTYQKTAKSFTSKPLKTSKDSLLKKVVKVILTIVLLAIAAVVAIFVIGFVIQLVITILTILFSIGVIVLIIIFSSSSDSTSGPYSPPPPLRGRGNRGRDGGSSKAKPQIPKEVKIDGKWYDVDIGWAGELELRRGMRKPEYFARETSVNEVFAVYDKDDEGIGEIDMRYKSWTEQIEEVIF